MAPVCRDPVSLTCPGVELAVAQRNLPWLTVTYQCAASVACPTPNRISQGLSHMSQRYRVLPGWPGRVMLLWTSHCAARIRDAAAYMNRFSVASTERPA